MLLHFSFDLVLPDLRPFYSYKHCEKSSLSGQIKGLSSLISIIGSSTVPVTRLTVPYCVCASVF